MIIDMDRQFDDEEFKELKLLEKRVTNIMNTSGIATWVTNICLTSALKYLWKTINLFQFLIFIANWSLIYPSNAQIVLDKVQNLIFMDWLPIDELLTWLSNKLGIEERCIGETCTAI